MMKFFQDVTQVKFTALDHWFNVSSIFCEIDLPFLSSPLTIRWYGVIIAFGLALAVLFGGRMAYKWKIDIYKMIDILIYGVLGGIIGARLYYVAFEWERYAADPLEIFRLWNGGLAIYGGLIGGLLCAFIVCKVEKINIPNLLDLCGMSFLIGQGIGRWGNFANQEAFGTNTTLPWGMYSSKTEAYLAAAARSGAQVDPSQPVHPTFLYESLWCLLGFAVLYIICKKARKFSGQIFLCYGIWYGAERAVVEGLRTDSLYITGTNIRTSQLLSILLVAVCAVLLVILLIKYTKHPKPIEGVDYFAEIPLYRFKRKAAEAKKEADRLTAAAEKAQAAGKADKAKRLTQQAEKQKALAEKNAALAAEDDKKRAAKKAAKAVAAGPDEPDAPADTPDGNEDTKE